jgi:hypothetical protein
MRLWTIMVVIAILAILMGFGAARRIDHRSDMVEIIAIHDSDRALGLTESRRVWIKVVRALPDKLTGLLIRPRKVMDLSHGKPGASVFYLLPLEYVAAVIYKSERVGGQVKSTYFGAGESGTLMANMVAFERLERAAEREQLREEREESEAEETAILEWFDGVQAVADAAMIAAGFHKHKGQWRRKGR